MAEPSEHVRVRDGVAAVGSFLAETWSCLIEEPATKIKRPRTSSASVATYPRPKLFD